MIFYFLFAVLVAITMVFAPELHKQAFSNDMKSVLKFHGYMLLEILAITSATYIFVEYILVAS